MVRVRIRISLPRIRPAGGVLQRLLPWCRLADYHQRRCTCRDGEEVWVSADFWQDMELLGKWSVGERKTAPRHEAAMFLLVDKISFIC